LIELVVYGVEGDGMSAGEPGRDIRQDEQRGYKEWCATDDL